MKPKQVYQEELWHYPKYCQTKYFCNFFPCFSPCLTHWAIDQIFPDHAPAKAGMKSPHVPQHFRISPVTQMERSIILFRPGTFPITFCSFDQTRESYYLGVFLVGAYQEILGDLHNLFGDTNAVHVSVTDDGYEIDQIIDGETVAEVLDYVQYNAKKLVRTVETWVTSAVKSEIITAEEG